MIDMEVMLLEARSRGLDQTPEQLEKWEGERKRKLIATFLQKRIQEKINLPPEELQRRFKESKWSRMLKLAHIRVKTEEEARQVMTGLAAGRAFEELARERSVYRQTAEQGGLLEPYFGRGNIDELGLQLEVAEQVFELKIGEYGGPYPFMGGYEVFKVVDERPAPAGYAIVFAQTTFLEAFNAQRQKVWAELRDKFDVRSDQHGLKYFLDKAAAAKGDTLRLDEQETETILCRFSGGQLTIGDFLGAYQRVAAPHRVDLDSSAVTKFIEDHLLPEALMYRSALEEGLEQDSTVAAWMKVRKKTLLIEALREREVEMQLDLGEPALRQYYQVHQERFMLPAEMQLVEILTKTEAEAEEMRQRILRGEDINLLAEGHSVRPGAAKTKGGVHMHPFERQRYRELYDTADKAEIGKLQGPVQVAEGYSVFKVLARLPARLQPFEQASTKVKYWLRQEEEKRLFEALLARLREQYRPEIVLFKDRLSKMVNAEAGT
ncbi:MAG: peptidyl-prolyl cis-trans isomerase [Candidatus Latescibacteria bacterium]|nr:peptidyl-prolyl cis-trans isomerase [Candidatus Latescibacterota bacterium]